MTHNPPIKDMVAAWTHSGHPNIWPDQHLALALRRHVDLAPTALAAALPRAAPSAGPCWEGASPASGEKQLLQCRPRLCPAFCSIGPKRHIDHP